MVFDMAVYCFNLVLEESSDFRQIGTIDISEYYNSFSHHCYREEARPEANSEHCCGKWEQILHHSC